MSASGQDRVRQRTAAHPLGAKSAHLRRCNGGSLLASKGQPSRPEPQHAPFPVRSPRRNPGLARGRPLGLRRARRRRRDRGRAGRRQLDDRGGFGSGRRARSSSAHPANREQPLDAQHTRSLADLSGLTADQLGSESGAPVNFRLDRDAGTIVCSGVARRWRGTGECRFQADAAFAAALADRGYGRASDGQLFSLALYDLGHAYIDELKRQDYARPTVADLVRAGDHGADLAI